MSHLTKTVVVLFSTLALLVPGVAGAQSSLATQQAPAGVSGSTVRPAARPRATLPAFPALGPYQLEPSPAYPLREAGDGSGELLYESAAFTARIARDGSVAFEDHRLRLLSPGALWRPRPGPRNVPSLQQALTALARGNPVPQVNPKGQTFPTAPIDEAELLLPYVSRYRPDPMELCRSCPVPRPAPWLTVAGRFDLTDELMRFSAQDPYRYGKAKFLAATRELRIERAAKFHAANVRRALAELPAMLQSIACDTARSRGERQAIIEALREELDEGTPEAMAAAQTIDDFSATRRDPDQGCGGHSAAR